jgi:ketoreductase RED1
VLQGVVTVDELDETMTSSIGPRWASSGVFLSSHIAGGTGGVVGFMHHFGPAFEDIWKDSGKVHLDDATDAVVAEQVDASFGKAGVEALTAARNEKQFAILKILRDMSKGSTGTAKG